ncbi:MAG: tryptophan--tRNA ligase, partial [Rhizobacter sp.]
AQREAFRQALVQGLGWGEAKQRTVDLIESHIGPMRAAYDELMAHPERVEAALQAGARKARAIARPLLDELRHAVGLRPMVAAARPTDKATRPAAARLPEFKQYREADGRFFFKLTDADGAELLLSDGLAEGRAAGAWVKRLKTEGAAALADAPVRLLADRAAVESALAALVTAQA